VIEQDDGALARVRSLMDLRRFEEAARALGPVLASEPDDPTLHLLMARCLRGCGRAEAALREAERALALDPDFVECYWTATELLLDLDRGANALHAAQRAVALAPNQPVSHYCRMRALAYNGSLDDAMNAARRTLELEPGSTLGWHCVGYVCSERGEFDAAEEAYRQALRIAPDDPELLGNLGTVLGALGKHEEAAACLDSALQLDPGSDWHRLNSAGVATQQVFAGKFARGLSYKVDRLGRNGKRGLLKGIEGDSFSHPNAFAFLLLWIAVCLPLSLVIKNNTPLLLITVSAIIGAVLAFRYRRLSSSQQQAIKMTLRSLRRSLLAILPQKRNNR
jgi:tetratricopeptide (TPR) repeat protein